MRTLSLGTILTTLTCACGPVGHSSRSSAMIDTSNEAEFSTWGGSGDDAGPGHLPNLRSSNGSITTGQLVLKLHLKDLSNYVCLHLPVMTPPAHAYSDCYATLPQLFLRFNTTQNFQEIQGLPQGELVTNTTVGHYLDVAFRGRSGEDLSLLPINLSVPPGSDRLELYMKWDRLKGDETRIETIYLSDFGRNYSLSVH